MATIASQNFASDSEDDHDFIPDEADVDSDSGSGDDGEDDAEEGDEGGPLKGKRKAKGRQGRKGGAKKKRKTGTDFQVVEEPPETDEQWEAAKADAERLELEAEAAKKKKLDELWAAMNAPVKQEKKPGTYLAAYAASLACESKGVIKHYEFAGQQFSVRQAADSSDTTQSASSPSTTPAPDDPPVRTAPRARKSRLLDIAAKYGIAHEAAKLTVLEKSKLDWMMHVEEAGDADRLSHHRKDGYLEKAAFLARTDERQAEHIQQMRRARLSRR
ncbi:hypothetical protein HK104_004902 [Borealophlyctis nickersoniae]|nr:hypothetical protein HK104_004902 [Borealophlyctis nickersoniae]